MALWLGWILWYNPCELGGAQNDLDYHVNKVFKLLKHLGRNKKLKSEPVIVIFFLKTESQVSKPQRTNFVTEADFQLLAPLP